MKKFVQIAVILLAGVSLAQTTPVVPAPPQSFCGFTFGVVHTGARSVILEKPFRYCSKAIISTTPSEQKVYRISVRGVTPDFMSDSDSQTEFSRMCDAVESRLGVKMSRNGKFYGYADATFKVQAGYRRVQNGTVSFDVTVTRNDISKSDSKSKRRGTPPLPPGDGIDSL